MTYPASDTTSPPADNNHHARDCTYDDYTTRELLGDTCRDFAMEVLGVFDLVGRGVITVMDYTERELCGPAMHKWNAHAELLANADRLNKLLEEAEKREEKASKNKFNPFNRKASSIKSLPAATTGVRQTCNNGLKCFESENVERSLSFFGNLFRKSGPEDASLSDETEALSVNDDVDITDTKENLQTKQPRSLTPNLLKKFLPPRDKPSQLKVKEVLMIPREEEPAPGGGGDSHIRPLKIVMRESAIVVGNDVEDGDDAKEGDAARKVAEVNETVPESTPSSFSEDLFVVDRQQLDSIEVDFKDSKKTTYQ